MKFNWKRLTALLLAAILMLSLTGMGEGEIVIEDDVSTEGIINEADIDIDATTIELDSMIDMLDNIDMQQDPVDIVEETPSQPAQATSEINADTTVTLGVSETYKLSTNGLGKNLTFESSKPKIASVTNKGIVKGLKKGTAQISILSGSKVKAKYTVKVVAAPNKVTLSATTITLGVKESLTMAPAIPKNTHTTFTWTSKNKKIATVSKTGKITGKKVGNTTVTVQTHNGKSATLKVVVKAAPKKVTLNKTSLKLQLYDEVQLKATLPKGSFSNKLTWTSSNNDVVAVFEDGWLFANAPGSATITVKTYNGKKATCKVTVVGDEEEEEEDTPTPEPTAEPTPKPTAEPTPEPTPQTPVLSADQTSLNIEAGKSQNVRITYLNDNTIAWKVSNSNIVTCKWVGGWDGDTCQLTITGLSAGSATVTVYDKTTQDYVDISVTVYGQVEKITELSKLMFKTIPEANAMLDLKLTYYKDNMYTCDYFSVLVDSNGTIDTVGFFNNYGEYTLMNQWPGRSLSNAATSLFNMGFKLQSDVDQLGTFTHPDLPGYKLLLHYSNSKVDYIIFGRTYSNVSNFF